MLFEELNLNPAIVKAAKDEAYEKVTPIQEKAIPFIMQGKDMLACAQTGTGKTAAYAMPILHRISKQRNQEGEGNPIKALVLAPTRELAIQIAESFETYGKYLTVQIGVMYGGITPKRHIKVLKKQPDILIATPGRLLDMVKQGHADLSHVEMFVLDEADRMLDLGMAQDVKMILSTLAKVRQNILLSATMPKELSKLITSIVVNPVRIEVEPEVSSEKEIKQQVYFVEQPDKTSLLLQLLKDQSFESVLIFVKTKAKADKVSKAINKANIRTKAIHADKNQSERLKALQLFKNKEIRVLVATDLAARGIDVENLSHVINLDLPDTVQTYIHRIGRTGRAGMEGVAISFCNAEEKGFLEEIEKFQAKEIEVISY